MIAAFAHRRQRRVVMRIWLAILLAATLAGGAARALAQPPNLYPRLAGSAWLLVEWNGAASSLGERANLAFTATDDLSGAAACNNFVGRFKLWGDRIDITVTGTTKMQCPGARMELDAKYIADLARVKRLELAADGTLVARGEDEAVIFRFRRAPAGTN
jgi:heat shock protein HslJ